MSNDHSKSTESNILLSGKDTKSEKLHFPRTPGQKSFVRHDASYVCTVCKVKFFTKIDIIIWFIIKDKNNII